MNFVDLYPGDAKEDGSIRTDGEAEKTRKGNTESSTVVKKGGEKLAGLGIGDDIRRSDEKVRHH